MCGGSISSDATNTPVATVQSRHCDWKTLSDRIVNISNISPAYTFHCLEINLQNDNDREKHHGKGLWHFPDIKELLSLYSFFKTSHRLLSRRGRNGIGFSQCKKAEKDSGQLPRTIFISHRKHLSCSESRSSVRIDAHSSRPRLPSRPRSLWSD